MVAIKLIAVDLDGTLLKSGSILASEGVAALREASEKGIHVVIATARRLYSVREFSVQIGISQPVICSDGAVIMSAPHGDIWQKSVIPMKVAEEIVSLADVYNWELSLVVDDITYFKRRSQRMSLGDIGNNRVVVQTCREMLNGEPFRILAHEPEVIEGLQTWFNDSQKHYPLIRYQLFHNMDGSVSSCGIFPDVDKGTGVKFVAERLNIALDTVLVIGDGTNDLPMFAIAGKSVAMGNAPDAVKQAAHWVAPSNNEEGVAVALRHFL
jgi:Cof subfamily protein (haloacid dehalogenase superfamily)